MTIKTTFTILSIAGLLFASPLSASAQTVTPVGPGQHPNQASQIAKLHQECDTQVTNRLTSLTNAQSRLDRLKKLSQDQKNQFDNEISSDKTGLTSVEGKCDADSQLPTLRDDYKTVFTTFRIYAEFLPQLHLLVASDTMGVTADKLSDLATKLQSRIQNAGNPGSLTSLLSDMQAKIADAKTQYNNVESQVASLNPQSYNSNPSGVTTTLKNARTEIQTGIADLKAAFSDAKQIVQALKAMHTTPSPTVTQ